jgi:hypothetical protein
MFLHVTRVEYQGGYSLLLDFNDGTSKEIDLTNELHGTVFEPLKDPAFFARAAVNPETMTIEWPNGADLAPEYLYELGTKVKQVA